MKRKYNKRKKELKKMRGNRYLEYKENTNSNTFMKTISAYANYGTGKQDLTFKHLEDELKNIMHIEKLNMDILKTLELYSDKTRFNNAGALLADQNTFKGIDSVRFGSNIDEIMDRETYENISILEQFSKIMEMFQKYYQYEKIEGKERKLVDKIPEKAFREAIANALVHRAWDVNASIKVSMYEDRIEISSPGGLPSELSEEEYLNGQISILRNPIIGNVFFRLKYIEKFGTGILRINYAYEESVKKPIYKVFDNSIMIILPVFGTKEKLTQMEQQLVQLLEENDEMSRKQIETELKLGKATAIRMLNNLGNRNIICKKGAGRAVKYTIAGK